MTEQNEKIYAGDVVVWEEEFGYCREVLTITDGEVVVPGSLLDESGGDYVVATTAAAIAAIALEYASPEGETADIVCLVRGPAIVSPDFLDTTSLTSDTSTRLADTAAQLITLGIKVTDPELTYDTLADQA